MGSSCYLFFMFILLFVQFHPISSSSLRAISSSAATTDLIQQTCKNTKYYDLCISSLESDESSPKVDTTGLALILIKVGINKATDTNTYLSSEILSMATNDTMLMMKRAMKECADKYASATEALQYAIQNLSAEMYDYAYMHVMAASDYPSSCSNGFKRYPGLVYPQELAKREDGLKHICYVVMEIINDFEF